MSAPQWHNVTVTLGELKPWSANPRMSTKAQAQRLIKSWKEFGQVEPIAIGPVGEVYNGHQRLSALLTAYGPGHTVDARRADRELTDEERQRLTIYLHAGAVGSWDWQQLSGWDSIQLLDWGMNESKLRELNEDVLNLKEMLASENEAEEDEEKYTSKVTTPIYEIRGGKPSIKELFDSSKYHELTIEIDKSDIPGDVKEFLKIAATRHIVFDFSKIAEYYAHADKLLQELMEKNALVIIDFGKAIEWGYVNLSNNIAAQMLEEYPDEQ